MNTIDIIRTIADETIEKAGLEPEITHTLIVEGEYIEDYYLPLDEELVFNLEHKITSKIQAEGIFVDIELKII